MRIAKSDHRGVSAGFSQSSVSDLEWFFNGAEADLGIKAHGLAPRLSLRSDGDDTRTAEAAERYGKILDALRALDSRTNRVIRAIFEPQKHDDLQSFHEDATLALMSLDGRRHWKADPEANRLRQTYGAWLRILSRRNVPGAHHTKEERAIHGAIMADCDEMAATAAEKFEVAKAKSEKGFRALELARARMAEQELQRGEAVRAQRAEEAERYRKAAPLRDRGRVPATPPWLGGIEGAAWSALVEYASRLMPSETSVAFLESTLGWSERQVLGLSLSLLRCVKDRPVLVVPLDVDVEAARRAEIAIRCVGEWCHPDEQWLKDHQPLVPLKWFRV